jgi:hypothetical protein
MSRGHGKWEVVDLLPPGYIRTRTPCGAWARMATRLDKRASDSLISRPRNHPLALPELRPPTRGKLPDRQRGSPRHRVLDLLAHFSLGRFGPPSGGGGVLFHGAASYLINRFKVRSTKPSLRSKQIYLSGKSLSSILWSNQTPQFRQFQWQAASSPAT